MAQEKIVQSITHLIDRDQLPHLLLYGPPGTGKTSTMVAAAKRMYGKQYASMTLELNASDARGIDVVRQQIKEFASTRQLFRQGVKLVILDEADALTSDAQFALRRIMEQSTKNCRFCLIGNYVSKIIPALQSRCTRFRFAPLAPAQIQSRLEHVAHQEGVPLTPDGAHAILALSGGDMRRVLNLLQSTAMACHGPVDEAAVYTTSGAPLPADVKHILHVLWNESFASATRQLSTLCTTKGYALADVLQNLTGQLLALELDDTTLAQLLDGMSAVEHRLAFGTDETLQLASLVGVFVQTRSGMVAAAS